jgi:hypothetical protein
VAFNDDNPFPNFSMSTSVGPGTYYVRVRHYSSGGTGAYTLNVNGPASAPSPPLPPADSDNDGLPDTWELLHFGGLSEGAFGDRDGDGVVNIAEFQGQTSPSADLGLLVFTPLH